MTFKICTIGCGKIAVGYHGPAYRRYIDQNLDVVLAACCDIEFTRAVEFRNRFGFCQAYQDYLVMLDNEKPDAVCLLVPPERTSEMASRILAKGYPLLTEKPPGRTVEEVDRVIAAARQKDVPNQVAFNRRYTPLLQSLRSHLRKNFRPEEIHHIRYDFTRIGRLDADFSTTAIHGIDAARYLVGSDYQSIRFHYQEFPHLGPSVANILMDCTFVSGATGQLNFHPVSGLVMERATIHVQDQTFLLNLPIWNAFDAPGRLQHINKGQVIFDATGQDVSQSEDEIVLNGFYAENASFFDDLRASRHPEGSLATGRQPVEIANLIRERKPEYSL
jgi:myo-inositol 2-dehydrogenase / D-chiro-inositol 1-dehydrogenase